MAPKLPPLNPPGYEPGTYQPFTFPRAPDYGPFSSAGVRDSVARTHVMPYRPAARETTSSLEYRENLQRHMRSNLDPEDKFSQPILTSQNVGWNIMDATLRVRNHLNFSRKQCGITQYFEEMAQNRLTFTCRAQNGGLEALHNL
eukprot:tig00021319_g20203.t1